MRLGRDRVDLAMAAVPRALDEARIPAARARLLPAYVEIMLASGDLGAARTAADELAKEPSIPLSGRSNSTMGKTDSKSPVSTMDGPACRPDISRACVHGSAVAWCGGGDDGWPGAIRIWD
jgi:hypothetical protein